MNHGLHIGSIASMAGNAVIIGLHIVVIIVSIIIGM